MISDSPYASGELLLKPGHGIAAGAGGGLLMLLLMQLLSPVARYTPAELLARIGLVVAPPSASASALTATGLALHFAVAGLLGLLYALSQRRIPSRGLIGVGLLYGFVIWVVGSLIIGRFLDVSVSGALRAWPWLLANLLYGLVLAAVAVYQKSRRSRQGQPVAVRD